MFTSPNMGLLIWNSNSDSYDSTELADNWAKVDQHDHTPGKGALIGTNAIAAGAITAAKLAPGAFADTSIADGSITAPKLGSASVQTIKIGDGQVTDAKLASPNNGVYRRLHYVSGNYFSGGAGNYWISASGSIINSGSIGTAPSPPVIYLDTADYAVAGKTTKLQIRANVAATTTPPAVTFTFGLYPISVTGSNWTLGAVTGNTAAITPGAGAITPGVSTDFTMVTGTYVLGVALSGTPSSSPTVSVQLQMRHV